MNVRARTTAASDKSARLRRAGCADLHAIYRFLLRQWLKQEACCHSKVGIPCNRSSTGEPLMVSSNSWPAEVTWNYDRVELIADGIVHAIGVSLGLAGAIAIVVVAANSQHNTELSSIVVYSVGLLSMFGFSAAYNTWPVSPAKRVLRRFDHLAVVLYLLLGWSGAFVYEPVVAALPSLGIWLLAAGGALYSMGVVFYAWRNLRFQNAIWHAFVLAAACCHYAAVLFCVANGWT